MWQPVGTCCLWKAERFFCNAHIKKNITQNLITWLLSIVSKVKYVPFLIFLCVFVCFQEKHWNFESLRSSSAESLSLCWILQGRRVSLRARITTKDKNKIKFCVIKSLNKHVKFHVAYTWSSGQHCCLTARRSRVWLHVEFACSPCACVVSPGSPTSCHSPKAFRCAELQSVCVCVCDSKWVFILLSGHAMNWRLVHGVTQTSPCDSCDAATPADLWDPDTGTSVY